MPQGEMRKPLLGGAAEPDVPACDLKSPAVGILGTGDFSRSLAHRLLACGLRVIVGSRSPDRNADRFPAGVEVSTQRDAAAQAHVLFVALFPDHYSSLAALKGELAGKVLVDVSNGTTLNRSRPSNAEELAALFPESSVVKGFNVLSAWALLNGPRDGSRQVLICSDDFQAKNRVALLARSMGFVPVDMGCLSSARDIENAPLYLFPSWGSPFLCAVCLFFSFYIYNFFRGVLLPYVIKGHNVFYKLPVEMVNETLPLVSLVMLALVYLPGLLAAGLQLLRGTKYQTFPMWLDRWLCMRKQLGLLSFFCAAMHALYSLCLPMRSSARYKLLNAAFKQVKLGQESSWMEQDVWRMELYLSFGIVALGVLSLLAVTSLPSVGNSLNWREFSFVQSGLGYAALSISTLHTLTFGWNRAFDPGQYEFYLPPTFVLAVLLPCIVLLGRLALALPCLSLRLARIRRGWETRLHQVHFRLPDEDMSTV
ncbi:metalloreductase STEAP3-like isoform X2 [Scleropages formosus]|uniref:STEAP3 metalloreductase n=2 Tax=Scleropages formosus TaxID=113540 RepID=A0A8C9W3Y8_SCLFO|nr:metalloreductase STEAP3-like isoform X2 [Scleropages formosus]XP_029105434.1 metalloreductase STEAP3-like isoform X2 [Scleropages formosus]XP_029105435.1 metalloreductase STEAP3-like isoform X2 [Scleropages formosus]XP_029105436.1 metalloreductase STEAP3-like isoform X2 [Scleropages formosus]